MVHRIDSNCSHLYNISGVFLWGELLKSIDQKIIFPILSRMYLPLMNSTMGCTPSLCHPHGILAFFHQDVLCLEGPMPQEEGVMNQGSTPHQGNVRETLSGPNCHAVK